MSYNGLLINTCDLKKVAVDKWGARSEVIEVGVVCRTMLSIKIVRNLRGEEVPSTAKQFFKKTRTIEPDYEVRLQGETRWRGILKILRPQDSIGHHHTEVYLE